MNIETGELRGPLAPEELRKMFGEMLPEERDNWVEVEPDSLTPEQRKTKHVSVHDTQSVLGKVYTSARKRRKAARKSS